jgi:hypothetical protein
VIAVTGVLLNHKRGLGLMPDVAHTPTGTFGAALPLERLARVALDTVARRAPAGRASTEVTVDLASGRVLHVGPRGDVFLERLHSGEIFGGQPWVLLSDAGALALLVTLGTGYWLWLAPKRGRRGAREVPAARPAVVEQDA